MGGEQNWSIHSNYFEEQRIISSVGPELHRKQKSSRFDGSQTKHLKVGSERQVSGTHLEWNVHLGRQIPVQVIKFPCTVDSLAPHLAHNSRKLSLASSSYATIVAPLQPGITGTTKPTPCSNLFANWKKNANCIRVQIWGYKKLSENNTHYVHTWWIFHNYDCLFVLHAVS